MSVLIEGMEMPKSCSDCPMLDWDLDYIKCKVTGRHFKVKEEPFGARRVDDCPLISVPEPHGRLIDADALAKMCQEMQSIEWNDKASPYSWAYAYESFEGDIDNAPTIIPAEEGE